MTVKEGCLPYTTNGRLSWHVMEENMLPMLDPSSGYLKIGIDDWETEINGFITSWCVQIYWNAIGSENSNEQAPACNKLICQRSGGICARVLEWCHHIYVVHRRTSRPPTDCSTTTVKSQDIIEPEEMQIGTELNIFVMQYCKADVVYQWKRRRQLADYNNSQMWLEWNCSLVSAT